MDGRHSDPGRRKISCAGAAGDTPGPGHTAEGSLELCVNGKSRVMAPARRTAYRRAALAWRHEVESWEALGVAGQEAAMGRTKDRSVELADRPESSHVARTDQDERGEIFRRNMPYGTVTAHGTMFVGFAAVQGPLSRMLDSMAGLDGPRDELTRYTTPETGGYYFVPALSALRVFASPDPEG